MISSNLNLMLFLFNRKIVLTCVWEKTLFLNYEHFDQLKS